MSDPTYGFGAARVRLCPDPLGSGRRPIGLGPALGGLWADLRARGFFASLGSGLRMLPGLALGAALILALVQTVSRERLDASDLHVVRFEPVPAREPVPVPEPEPVPREEPPAPPVVAKREPPPPELRLEPPAPPKPQPALPPIARRAPPPPQPAASRASPPRQASPARPRPDLRIDAVARAQTPAAPARVARAARPAAEPAPQRPFFQLAMPAAPTPAARSAAAPRIAPRPEAPSRPSPPARTARPGGLAVAPLAAAPQRPAAPPAAPARVARQAPSAAPRPAAADESQLRGVPLGSLAACVSDRREDELKLRVMAERGGVGECASSAGHYRFVETRNLNAFLMWVERAPTRRAADRCAELTLALECLAQQRGRSRST